MARQPAEQPAKAPPKDQRAPQTTASEDRLAETQQDSQENLEEQAKSEQSQRDEELGASKQSRLEKAASKVQPAEGGTPAGARAGHHARADTQGGFMDQMSVRSHADALEGHFVTIDLQAKGVRRRLQGRAADPRLRPRPRRVQPPGQLRRLRRAAAARPRDRHPSHGGGAAAR
jgi:hypothetical protein